MKSFLCTGVAAAIALFAAAPVLAQTLQPNYMVAVKQSATLTDAQLTKIITDAGGTVTMAKGAARFAVLPASTSSTVISKIKANTNIEGVIRATTAADKDQQRSTSQPTAADFLLSEQWHLRATKATEAWSLVSKAAQEGVTVAIIDSGVSVTHPDLKGKIVYQKAIQYCPETNRTDAHPIYSRALTITSTGALACTTPPTVEYNGHGTGVASFVAARTGGGALIGVAPDVKLASYKIGNRLYYKTSSGAQVDVQYPIEDGALMALIDAADRGYPIAVMSLDFSFDETTEEGLDRKLIWNDVLVYAYSKGTQVVAAAGNSGRDLSASNTTTMPANGLLVQAVTAYGAGSISRDSSGNLQASGTPRRANYSNHSPQTSAAIAAPGGDCGPTSTCDLRYFVVGATVFEADEFDSSGRKIISKGQDGYRYWAGTSFSAPIVAGAYALVRAKMGPSSVQPQWRNEVLGATDLDIDDLGLTLNVKRAVESAR